LPRLRLLHQQRADLGRRINAMLDELATPAQDKNEHRDAAILLSLPGLGRKIAATMLSEASQAIADRDYHALRCYSGAAPITARAAKENRAHAPRHQHAIAKRSLPLGAVSVVFDPQSKKRYAAMRACDTRMEEPCAAWPDRWLKTLTPCSPPDSLRCTAQAA